MSESAEYRIEIETEPKLTDKRAEELIALLRMSTGEFPAAYALQQTPDDVCDVAGYIETRLGDSCPYANFVTDLVMHQFPEVTHVEVTTEQQGEDFPDNASEEADRDNWTPEHDIPALLEQAKQRRTIVMCVVCHRSKAARSKSWIEQPIVLDGALDTEYAKTLAREKAAKFFGLKHPNRIVTYIFALEPEINYPEA